MKCKRQRLTPRTSRRRNPSSWPSACRARRRPELSRPATTDPSVDNLSPRSLCFESCKIQAAATRYQQTVMSKISYTNRIKLAVAVSVCVLEPADVLDAELHLLFRIFVVVLGLLCLTTTEAKGKYHQTRFRVKRLNFVSTEHSVSNRALQTDRKTKNEANVEKHTHASTSCRPRPWLNKGKPVTV